MKYFIAPRSGEKSYKNFQSTIKNGVPFSRISSLLNQEGRDILFKQEVIYAWGNRAGKKSEWNKMRVGDVVIFYANYNFVLAGTIIYKQFSPELALAMWPPDEKGNPWAYTFFINNLHYFKIPIEYFNQISGYNFRSVQGFQEITPPHLELIQQKYPTLDDLFKRFIDEASSEIPKQNEPVNMNIPDEIHPEYLKDFRLKKYEEPMVKDKTGRYRGNLMIDFEEKNKRNAITGNRGEEMVLKDEKDHLISLGRKDLAERVKRVSTENVSAGYDILSYDKFGNEKKIEVKSTTIPIGASFSFNISSNEMKVANESNNYYIFVVFAVNSKSPKIISIKNPFTLEGLLRLEPTQFKVIGQIEKTT